MADSSSTLDQLRLVADQRLIHTHAALRNQEASCAFFDDGSLKDQDAIYALFARKNLLAQLKGFLGQAHTAADWAVPKIQMEYLARWERDVRARGRTRLDRYRAAAQEKLLIQTNLDQLAEELGRIRAQQQSS